MRKGELGEWEGVSDEERDNRTGVPRAAAKKVVHCGLPSVKPGRLRGISFRCPSPEVGCMKGIRQSALCFEDKRLRAWRTWSVDGADDWHHCRTCGEGLVPLNGQRWRISHGRKSGLGG